MRLTWEKISIGFNIIMDTDSIYTIIRYIDRQISKVQLLEANKPAVDHLMELRNSLLLTYRPDSCIDWTFKNKRLLKFFNKEVKWVTDAKEFNI